MRQGKPWTAEEDDRLRAAWSEGGATLEELVEEHGRSLGGILSRLVRLEIVESRKEAREEAARRLLTRFKVARGEAVSDHG